LYIFSQFASGPQLLISQQSGPQRKRFGDPCSSWWYLHQWDSFCPPATSQSDL